MADYTFRGGERPYARHMAKDDEPIEVRTTFIACRGVDVFLELDGVEHPIAEDVPRFAAAKLTALGNFLVGIGDCLDEKDKITWPVDVQRVLDATLPRYRNYLVREVDRLGSFVVNFSVRNTKAAKVL